MATPYSNHEFVEIIKVNGINIIGACWNPDEKT
jgi:hypothetical protein